MLDGKEEEEEEGKKKEEQNRNFLVQFSRPCEEVMELLVYI